MMCSFDRAFLFLRCSSAKSVADGKIPRFKVLSWHHQGSSWSRACHKQTTMIGKRQPPHSFFRNADGTTQVDSRIDRLHKAVELRLWMLVPESLATLVAEVRLTYIGVSKTNDHSRGLTVSCTED
ncbi:Hypothetical_protein [Hexamita inflata]|uniref:Hypothetical_protein n=1 Tax=Hexamita inflata TaxID=28002 RepID=A0AA86TDU3_9EUKA|nr:Hypothetical protein HINF_LOCUS2397 [Hexamita inflata]CAI9914756.1 Hypothetical protein HINF_LOCUS2401 [Hexamita inflata]